MERTKKRPRPLKAIVNPHILIEQVDDLSRGMRGIYVLYKPRPKVRRPWGITR
jgi:hypothetical protein